MVQPDSPNAANAKDSVKVSVLASGMNAFFDTVMDNAANVWGRRAIGILHC
jgi:hypothetical protein